MEICTYNSFVIDTKGSRSDDSNYRPVSNGDNTAIQHNESFKTDTLFSNKQFGFVKGRLLLLLLLPLLLQTNRH